MHVNIGPHYSNKENAVKVSKLIRQCVHCGFCNATCPTYQILGDERDGPRGRISIIKDLLEEKPNSKETLRHLDKCLLCRNCETTCPSGVKYSQIYELGKPFLEKQIKRPVFLQLTRFIARKLFLSSIFGLSIYTLNFFRPIIPKKFRYFLPTKTAKANIRSLKEEQVHTAKGENVLVFRGCVQKSLRPSISKAAEQVLTLAGFNVTVASNSVCCGALEGHLSDKFGKLSRVRENIKYWGELIEKKSIDTILVTASACAYEIKDYASTKGLSKKEKAIGAKITARLKDISELLPQIYKSLKNQVSPSTDTFTFHPPCTLQHGLKITNVIEPHLEKFGYKLKKDFAEKNLCCGSAGTYSLFNPKIANELRDRKLRNIDGTGCNQILTANIGCITHLQSGTEKSVKHWVEILAEDLV
jgi:glycolate oxidase iron-sulfur subunit